MGEQKPEKTKKHICAGLLAHVLAGMTQKSNVWGLDVVTSKGECEIIWTTREKPDFMRVYAA